MAALTDRQAARQQVTAAFQKALDQMIPLDDSRPLRGRTFEAWERQADAFDRAVPCGAGPARRDAIVGWHPHGDASGGAMKKRGFCQETSQDQVEWYG